MVLSVSTEERRILNFLPLVKAKAWQFYRGRLVSVMTREELIAIGMVAVWKATRTWNAERGATFETYAHDAVVHSMMQEQLRFGRLARRGTTRSLSLDEHDQNDTEFEIAGHTPTPEQIVSARQLRSFVAKLPHPFRRVVERHYSDETLADVGKEIGLSRERVRQIEWQGMRLLERLVLTASERRERRG